MSASATTFNKVKAAAAVVKQSQSVYTPPRWIDEQRMRVPATKMSIARLPTPVQRFSLPTLLPEGVNLYIKRDDLTGMQLSGNKVRKLEFLISDAINQDADTVITIGGIQSNHARATAVAAKYFNLDAHLVLRTSRMVVDDDPGLTGNLLVERMIGASIHLVSKEEYGKIGSETLTEMVREKLLEEGKKPYVIPVGGSNACGSWGYVEMIRELEMQIEEAPDGTMPQAFENVIVACGSGGTVAGLSLALDLSDMQSNLLAYGVCDSPDYFYNYVDKLIQGMYAQGHKHSKDARQMFTAIDAKNLGYAISSDAELEFCHDVAKLTGVILDPVYSGKALHRFVLDVNADPDKWVGKNVLFIHTGGLLGMYDKVSQLQPLICKNANVHRLKV